MESFHCFCACHRQDQTAEKKDETPTTTTTPIVVASAAGTQEPKTIEAGKEAAMEAEVKAARERAIIPLEIRMKQFRDMLAEKDVSNNNIHDTFIPLGLTSRSNARSVYEVITIGCTHRVPMYFTVIPSFVTC